MNDYIGNCKNLIDWNKVIENLEKSDEGEIFNKKRIEKLIEDISKDVKNSSEIEHNKQTSVIWKENNYFLDSINFKLYRPGKNYEHTICDIISSFLKGKYLTSSISRVDPGFTVGIHRDSTPNLLLDKTVKRYVIFINPPEVGQIFILGDECFHNEELGNIYEWRNMDLLHSAANTSFKSQYLFHIECKFDI